MQITTLIIAPIFFTAALYVLLGVLIKLLERQSSLLSARMYAIVFVTCDVISLVVQVSGLSRKDFSLMPVSLAISQDHACLILIGCTGSRRCNGISGFWSKKGSPARNQCHDNRCRFPTSFYDDLRRPCDRFHTKINPNKHPTGIYYGHGCHVHFSHRHLCS
jgi:hypothetical protein